MNGGKILGVLIIIVLILSVAVAGYNTLTKSTDNDEKIVQTTSVMDESDLNQTFTEDGDDSIQTVTLNINQKVGGSRISFADNSSTIYNITSNNEENKTTTVTTNQNGSNIEVNIDSEEADNEIILSNKYNYTINGDIVTGGFSSNISKNAHIDEINLNLTAGGVDIEFDGGSLNTLNSMITTGGLNIIGEPKGETRINSEIEVGGLNLQIDKPIADIFSEIEVGGINPGDYQQIGDKEYKGNLFDSSENKLIINNTIRLGGVNTQSF